MASAALSPPSTALVEGGAELEVLQQALERVREGAGELVFLAGEAGVGKTSILRTFADEHGATRVLWGAGDPLFTPRPLGRPL
jgi:alpha-D-ribose 1-methylphosphonate 5-triphosphate synthase subunit PhnL